MKIAVVRNTPDPRIFQQLGRKNREYYRESDVEAVRDALRAGGHRAEIIEGDLGLLDALADFFLYREPADLDDAIVFNLAYGVQGECRYSQVPSILELVGIPYVGSGPRAHTICLDKYLAKAVFERAGLPTPAFDLLTRAGQKPRAGLRYPLIVKPQSESTSFGVRVVQNETEVEEAAAAILSDFRQPVLVEEYITGTEVNCGVLGNDPPEALPVLEIDFGDSAGALAILSFEAKRDRVATHLCPARISAALTERIQDLAVAAFRAAGCHDAARIDVRIDCEGNPFILEINSMVAIHRDGSYFHAAKTLGMSYAQLIQRVLAVAVARWERV